MPNARHKQNWTARPDDRVCSHVASNEPQRCERLINFIGPRIVSECRGCHALVIICRYDTSHMHMSLYCADVEVVRQRIHAKSGARTHARTQSECRMLIAVRGRLATNRRDVTTVETALTFIIPPTAAAHVLLSQTLHIHTNMSAYAYMCVCACVCVAYPEPLANFITDIRPNYSFSNISIHAAACQSGHPLRGSGSSSSGGGNVYREQLAPEDPRVTQRCRIPSRPHRK